jgi:hypothetical protein
MRKITQVLTFAAVLGLLAVSQLGCASSKGVGDEKTSMFKGTQTIVYGDPVAVTSAAKSAAEELQLTVVSNTASGLDGKLVVRTAQNVKVTVDVKTAGENYSRLTIRAAGFSGDKDLQKTYLEHIKSRLPAAPEGEAPVAKNNAKGSTPSAQAPGSKAPAAGTPAPAPAPEAKTDTAHLPF